MEGFGATGAKGEVEMDNEAGQGQSLDSLQEAIFDKDHPADRRFLAHQEQEQPQKAFQVITPEQALESLNEFTRFWHRVGGDQGDAPDAHLCRRFIQQQIEKNTLTR